jgi:cysteine desulfurase
MEKSNLSAKAKAPAEKIYLDYASSVSPNPSSIHFLGIEAKKKLEKARKKIAEILKTQPRNIIFTSGGTESNNLAIQGVVFWWHENNRGLPHLITTNIEHSSILETFRLLEKRKLAQISIVPVGKNGIVDSRKIIKEIKKNTILISVIYANNEIGTIEPLREITKEIRYYKKKNKKIFPLFHTDAVQAVNYLDLRVEKLGVDLLSFSGSKIEGAGRVGVLFKRKAIPLVNVFGGGDQEFGLRPGTENVPLIMDLARALEITEKIKEKENKRVIILRDYFIKKLLNLDSKIKINGDLENRLPNNINITIPKIPSDLLVLELSARGIYLSEKSACKSGDKKNSYVIEAISGEQMGSLRFSLGRQTTKSEIDYTVKSLFEILKKLKKWYTR